MESDEKRRKVPKSAGKRRKAKESSGEHLKGMASNGGDQNPFNFLPPRRRGFLVAGAWLFFFGSKGSVER
jgi:hypothetical protein